MLPKPQRSWRSLNAWLRRLGRVMTAKRQRYLRRCLTQRYANLLRFVGWIEDNGPLRNGLSRDDAAAAVWTLTSIEVFRLLRTNRRWSKTKYRRWLTDSLIRLLLSDDPR